MLALPSASRSLWWRDMLPEGRRGQKEGEEEKEGWIVQWSSVKSRLCFMKREALPSHWAEFTSSHNHLSLYPTRVSIQQRAFLSSCLRPSVPPSCPSPRLSSVTLHPICMSPFALLNLPVQGNWSSHARLAHTIMSAREMMETRTPLFPRVNSNLTFIINRLTTDQNRSGPTDVGEIMSDQHGCVCLSSCSNKKKTKCLSTTNEGRWNRKL